MSVFGAYARYYDLLYRDKDYAAEAAFVSGMLRAAAPGATTLLELGCGTGRHALELARLGWRVSGVDLSAEMVAGARARLRAAPPDMAGRLDFSEGDVRRVRLHRRFDAVISLFHVMSYQTTNEDLSAAVTTAAVHLSPGGMFFFDFWYGPAVLTDPPATRVKRLENETLQVTRIAEPTMRPESNGVVVNYDIFLKEQATGAISEVKEQHPMRYLFLPEIAVLLQQHGMTVQRSSAWMNAARPLGPDTWYGCVMARLEPGAT